MEKHARPLLKKATVTSPREVLMGLISGLKSWLFWDTKKQVVADFVPRNHPVRLFADTIPWSRMVEAIERSFSKRFPKKAKSGRPGISTRVLLALEILKNNFGCSDEQICERMRTDFAILYSCGIEEVEFDNRRESFVLPETLSQFRNKLDEELVHELVTIQGADAIDRGLVSPEHLVIDTFPMEQGTQRVNDASTLYQIKKKL